MSRLFPSSSSCSFSCRPASSAGPKSRRCEERPRVLRDNKQSQPHAIVAAAKEAGISALIAFGLFVTLIGVRTDQGPTGALILTTRFSALATIVAVVFVGA